MNFNGLSADQRLNVYNILLGDADPDVCIGSWEWSPVTGVVLWSTQVFQMLGLDPLSTASSPDLLRSMVHPDDSEYVDRMIAKAGASGTAPQMEYRVIVPDGSTRTLRTRGGALRDEQGEVTHLMGTVMDITPPAASPPRPEPTSLQIVERRIQLHEPECGGGGFAVFLGRKCQLSLLRYSLLSVLLQRHRNETGQHPSTRGFVQSVELIAEMPWDTPRPSAANLKQVIRPTRELLKGTGLAIESKRGLGYRLWHCTLETSP